MIFGFGKEKVDYTHGALFFVGNVWSSKKILKKVWDEAALDKLANFEENSQKIDMALSRFNRGIIAVTPSIPDDQAEDLNKFITMYRYFGVYDIPDDKLNVMDDFNTFKEYVDADEQIERILERNMGKENPVASFLYGLLDVLEIEESSWDELVNRMLEVKVILELDDDEEGEEGNLLNWIQGVAANNNQYFQKAKFRVSEQDQDMFHAVIDEGSYVDFIR